MTEAASVWTAAERNAWALPARATVSEWADANRVLDQMTSAEPGQWSTDRTPYLREIMDSFNDRGVEDIVIMKATQIGGTEVILNCLGYMVDQDPGPALVVYPTEPLARGVSEERIKPMVRRSPALRRHLTPRADDFAALRYRFDRMVVSLAWAGSPAAVASRPVRVVFLDEIDKYPKFAGREADPIKLSIERTKTFYNRKHVKLSTPTTKEGYVWREYKECCGLRYYVPCPKCSRYQALTFGRVKWPEDERDPNEIKRHGLAWYECVKCSAKIEDADKPEMLRRGVWAPDGASIDTKGRIRSKAHRQDKAENPRRGYWINAIYSPWVTFSMVAAEFLRSKEHPELLQNFVNSWLAEPWEEITEAKEPEKLKALATTTPAGVVPNGAQLITAGVDVQKDHFYLSLRAWGFHEESWLVLAMRVEEWSQVIDYCFTRDYPKESGDEALPVRLSCIDAGYRTSEVYEIARRYPDVCRAVKGHANLRGPQFRVSMIDRNPSDGRPIPGGLRLWNVDVSFFKDKIARLVETEPGEPGNWHLHEDPSEEYLRQFCAERKVIDRNRKTGQAVEEWRLVAAGAPNHYLDCEVYSVAAATMLQVSALKKAEGRRIHRPEPRRKKGRSWLGSNRGGWLRGE